MGHFDVKLGNFGSNWNLLSCFFGKNFVKATHMYVYKTQCGKIREINSFSNFFSKYVDLMEDVDFP